MILTRWQVLFFIFWAMMSKSTFAQPIVDTSTETRTTTLLSPEKFNGIMNLRIHEIVNSFSSPLNQSWNNNSVNTGRGNNLQLLKDTIWICLNEGSDNGTMDFSFPLRKLRVTSRYAQRDGRYHNGVDLGLRIGDTVFAMFSGKVRYAKYNDGGFGNLVILRHFNGLETFYGHLSKFLVTPNQDVRVGDPIALGGNTGRSTGPHLHVEVRFYDATINPEEIIDFDNAMLKKENLLLHKGLFRPAAKPSGVVEVLSASEIAQINNSLNQPNTNNDSPVVKPVVKESQKKYYLIKSGDTLTRIAAKYNTTVSKLCSLNGLSPSSTLIVGKNIRVK